MRVVVVIVEVEWGWGGDGTWGEPIEAGADEGWVRRGVLIGEGVVDSAGVGW